MNEDNIKLEELIALTKDNNEKQEKYRQTMLLLAKCVTVGVCALLGCIALFVFIYAPKLNNVLTRVDAMLEEGETIIANAEKITDDLAAIDLEETMENINTLVLQTSYGITSSVDTLNEVSQTVLKIDFEGINKAIGEMSEINFDTLNKAISDLSAVIEPLARLFKR